MDSGLFVLKHVSLALAALILEDLGCPCPDKQGFQGRSGWAAVLNMSLLCKQQAWRKASEKNLAAPAANSVRQLTSHMSGRSETSKGLLLN